MTTHDVTAKCALAHAAVVQIRQSVIHILQVFHQPSLLRLHVKEARQATDTGFYERVDTLQTSSRACALTLEDHLGGGASEVVGGDARVDAVVRLADVDDFQTQRLHVRLVLVDLDLVLAAHLTLQVNDDVIVDAERASR